MTLTGSSFNYTVKLDNDKTYTPLPKIKCGVFNNSESDLSRDYTQTLSTTPIPYQYYNLIKCGVKDTGTISYCQYNLIPSSNPNDSIDLKMSLQYTPPPSLILLL